MRPLGGLRDPEVDDFDLSRAVGLFGKKEIPGFEIAMHDPGPVRFGETGACLENVSDRFSTWERSPAS